MLNDGQLPRYLPNWWNPYAPNVGQKDPLKKQKMINTIKLVFVVITMLAGAILALCINVFFASDPVTANSSVSSGNTSKSGRCRGESMVLLPRRTIKKKSPTTSSKKSSIKSSIKSSVKSSIKSSIKVSAKPVVMRKADHKMKTQRTSKRPRHHRH